MSKHQQEIYGQIWMAAGFCVALLTTNTATAYVALAAFAWGVLLGVTAWFRRP